MATEVSECADLIQAVNRGDAEKARCLVEGGMVYNPPSVSGQFLSHGIASLEREVGVILDHYLALSQHLEAYPTDQVYRAMVSKLLRSAPYITSAKQKLGDEMSR